MEVSDGSRGVEAAVDPLCSPTVDRRPRFSSYVGDPPAVGPSSRPRAYNLSCGEQPGVGHWHGDRVHPTPPGAGARGPTGNALRRGAPPGQPDVPPFAAHYTVDSGFVVERDAAGKRRTREPPASAFAFNRKRVCLAEQAALPDFFPPPRADLDLLPPPGPRKSPAAYADLRRGDSVLYLSVSPAVHRSIQSSIPLSICPIINPSLPGKRSSAWRPRPPGRAVASPTLQ